MLGARLAGAEDPGCGGEHGGGSGAGPAGIQSDAEYQPGRSAGCGAGGGCLHQPGEADDPLWCGYEEEVAQDVGLNACSLIRAKTLRGFRNGFTN